MDWRPLPTQEAADAFLTRCIMHDAALRSIHFDVVDGEPTSATLTLETCWGEKGRYQLLFEGVKAIRINGVFDTAINEMMDAVLRVERNSVLWADDACLDDTTTSITARTCAWRKLD